MYYGRAGAVINAISGVDLALWDLVGNALNMPVYKLLGGPFRERCLINRAAPLGVSVRCGAAI